MESESDLTLLYKEEDIAEAIETIQVVTPKLTPKTPALFRSLDSAKETIKAINFSDLDFSNTSNTHKTQNMYPIVASKIPCGVNFTAGTHTKSEPLRKRIKIAASKKQFGETVSDLSSKDSSLQPMWSCSSQTIEESRGDTASGLSLNPVDCQRKSSKPKAVIKFSSLRDFWQWVNTCFILHLSPIYLLL